MPPARHVCLTNLNQSQPYMVATAPVLSLLFNFRFGVNNRVTPGYPFPRTKQVSSGLSCYTDSHGVIPSHFLLPSPYSAIYHVKRLRGVRYWHRLIGISVKGGGIRLRSFYPISPPESLARSFAYRLQLPIVS